MPNILLIHGSTVGLTYSVFKQADTKYGSFTGVKDLIDSGQIDVFRWADRSFRIKFYELFKILKLYRAERADIHHTELTKCLFDHIVYGQYTTIITHSMGSELLATCINKHGMPASVENIYDLGSDAPRKAKITDSEILVKLQNGDIKWYNYHCFWDQSLLTSVLVNLRLPAGLTGIKNPHIKNRFYPLHGAFDLHTSIIKKPKEIRKICLRYMM